jgi:ssDNA-binding Zn-finger/Zn-ribbon topoisomerase 1
MENNKETKNKNIKITFCPNCGSEGKLVNREGLGQGVKECPNCESRFFILLTSVKNKFRK